MLGDPLRHGPYHLPAACEVDWPDVFRQLLRASAFEPGPCRRMNVFPGPSGSVKALLSRKSGWLQARTDLPGRLRAGAARRSRASAASVFAGVALLALASCSGSGPAPGGPAGQAGSASATSASTGQPAAGSASPPATGAQPGAVPEPTHTVVVVMENHSYAEIMGNPAAPFINTFAGHGALFTRSYAITHPSQPNYLALFSGGTQGITDDSCPHQFTAPNLAADLRTAGKSFAGYAEDLPGPGSPVCSAGGVRAQARALDRLQQRARLEQPALHQLPR